MDTQGLANTKYKTSTGVSGAVDITLTPAALDSPTIEANINVNGFDITENNKVIGCGELGIVQCDELQGDGFYIDDKSGELFVSGETAQNYTIPTPANGQLVYTFR